MWYLWLHSPTSVKKAMPTDLKRTLTHWSVIKCQYQVLNTSNAKRNPCNCVRTCAFLPNHFKFCYQCVVPCIVPNKSWDHPSTRAATAWLFWKVESVCKTGCCTNGNKSLMKPVPLRKLSKKMMNVSMFSIEALYPLKVPWSTTASKPLVEIDEKLFLMTVVNLQVQVLTGYHWECLCQSLRYFPTCRKRRYTIRVHRMWTNSRRMTNRQRIIRRPCVIVKYTNFVTIINHGNAFLLDGHGIYPWIRTNWTLLKRRAPYHASVVILGLSRIQSSGQHVYLPWIGNGPTWWGQVRHELIKLVPRYRRSEPWWATERQPPGRRNGNRWVHPLIRCEKFANQFYRNVL